MCSLTPSCLVSIAHTDAISFQKQKSKSSSRKKKKRKEGFGGSGHPHPLNRNLVTRRGGVYSKKYKTKDEAQGEKSN